VLLQLLPKHSNCFQLHEITKERTVSRDFCHPKKTHNHRGEPRWEGGLAERLLKLDIADNKHLRLKPEVLRITKAAYQDYPLKVFRNHIDQEVRAQKFLTYHRAKKNKKLRALGLPPLDETEY
jgi:hypothetical protein